ncbi:MAG: hypothetical protein OXJ52_08550 [Oligoflexia bacterium]|nr:hypothetical protein [Oligoflexia bacterium]
MKKKQFVCDSALFCLNPSYKPLNRYKKQALRFRQEFIKWLDFLGKLV